MTDCLTVQHLKRINTSKIATDPLLLSIAASVIGLIEDIKETKISQASINYLVDLLPSLYEEDGTGLLMMHLTTNKPDCFICEAIADRLSGGTA